MPAGLVTAGEEAKAAPELVNHSRLTRRGPRATPCPRRRLARRGGATRIYFGFGGGLPFSNAESGPYLATIFFLVSSPFVISMTNVGTRRA